MRLKEHGIEVYNQDEALDKLRESFPDAPHRASERYVFDFGICNGGGWLQYDTDQDDWYYGVWIHREKFLTLCYAEGDVILTVSPDKEAFKVELTEMNAFHGAPPPFAVTGDGMDSSGKLENAQVFVDAESRSLDF